MNNIQILESYQEWRKGSDIPMPLPKRIDDALDDATSALKIVKQFEWQPIETAPMDGTEFVAAYAKQGFVKELVSWNKLHGYWQSKGEWNPSFKANCTHWMPLPEAPKI